MLTDEQSIIERLAQKSFRRFSTSDLIYEIQDIDRTLVEERDPERRFFFQCLKQHVLREFIRRDTIKFSGIIYTNQNAIQTLKESIPIEDVIDWYCEVTVYKGDWRFRCTQHGEDKTPSGKIYRDEKRWWCFGCNKGGDIFDAVQHFERQDLLYAMQKLAKYKGIDLRHTSLEPHNEPTIERRVKSLEDSFQGLVKSVSGKKKPYINIL